jgi:hypothetical protein
MYKGKLKIYWEWFGFCSNLRQTSAKSGQFLNAFLALRKKSRWFNGTAENWPV